MAKKFNFLVKYGFDDEGAAATTNETCYSLNRNIMGGCNSIIQIQDGFLIGGNFYPFILKILDDLSIDTSFNYIDSEGFAPFEANVNVICLNNEKIIVGTSDIEGIAKIFQINIDGTIDESFTPVELDSYVKDIKIYNNKILAAGAFTGGLILYNTDGTIDNSFSAIVDTEIDCIAIQSDNKIIAGGMTTGHLVRLNSDGSIDNTFTPTIDNQVHSIAIQSDNKILVGGSFTNYLVRLNSDGSIDNTFTPTIDNQVRSIAIQSDNKILVGVINAGYLFRLNTNGVLDSFPYTFEFRGTSLGSGPLISQILIDSDENIICIGSFDNYAVIMDTVGNAINEKTNIEFLNERLFGIENFIKYLMTGL